MDQNSMDVKVKTTVLHILNADHQEEGFSGFLVLDNQNNTRWKYESCLDMLKKFWSTLQGIDQISALTVYVAAAHDQKNIRKSSFLLYLLEGLVESNEVTARIVCEALITSSKLSWMQPEEWCLTFKIIRLVIGGVHYKGCRDLLRLMLEKAQTIPPTSNVSSLKVATALMDVISYVLDRNACLLPAYFAINEITKLCNDKPWPHWIMGKVLGDFVQTFRMASQMVTVSGRSHLLPVVGHSNSQGSVWKLGTNNLRFALSGPLPYDKELYDAQNDLLMYVLEQPYSRDMVCHLLTLNKQIKQRCAVLEDQLVNLVVIAMERSEKEDSSNDDNDISKLLWQHLSSQLIFFVLFQFASFPHMVLALYDKLKGRNLKKGRDHLMWVLLQFISGSIQKNPLSDFLPVMKLYDLLYPEKDQIPVPDYNHHSSTHSMAATCIWIHLNKKAQGDKITLQRPIPHALKAHLDFLKQTLNLSNLTMKDYRIALICNAYSTNTEYFNLPLRMLVDGIYGNGSTTTLLPGNIQVSAPTIPLRMDLLDSLTVHAKMSLIHSIVTRIIRLSNQGKAPVGLAPALIETYSRLLVYMEIESLGIKGFISQLLPNVFKTNAWDILHTLLEMASYRLHHIQAHYRIGLLSQLHSLASVPQTNQNQLHLCVESTALRLIMGFGSAEVQPQLSRVVGEPKSSVLISQESEELNRVLVLTLARAMHVTGSESVAFTWSKDILNTIQQYTPHSWSSHTLACFPPALAEFFTSCSVTREDKTTLKNNVDIEYRKWKGTTNENDLIAHFSIQGSPPLFICVLWRSLREDRCISPTAYKVLERLGPRALSTHIRIFTDYLVDEFSSSPGSQYVQKNVETLGDLIWQCNVVPIDRLVLTLVLRNFEGNEAQVCFYIVQLILLKPTDFRNRVKDFVAENSPEHWLQNDWHEKHMSFHNKYKENFHFEGIQGDVNASSTQQYLPVYFGNVCLRFLPVFDILIHRYLEISQVSCKSLDSILDYLGGLYKFHDRPMTYLYNTLHYYEKKLRERPAMKRKLVSTIIGSLSENRPAEWCLTEEYNRYLNEEANWVPKNEYYVTLIRRLVDTIGGNPPPVFTKFDWRFNEFPNHSAHALHATCIELMALPLTGSVVGNALLDIVLKGSIHLPRDKVMSWMNAIGLILTALPECYWYVLNERISETLNIVGDMIPFGSSSDSNTTQNKQTLPFQIFSFNKNYEVIGENTCSYLIALCHAVWQHSSIGQLSTLPQFIKDNVKPSIKTESHFLFVCHLVGPFLQRFHNERTRCLLELTVELYEMLDLVDKNSSHLHYMDSIADFLYHIKYMYVGDGVKQEVEKVIRNLRTPLQMRLRFIASHNKEDATPPT